MVWYYYGMVRRIIIIIIIIKWQGILVETRKRCVPPPRTISQ